MAKDYSKAASNKILKSLSTKASLTGRTLQEIPMDKIRVNENNEKIWNVKKEDIQKLVTGIKRRGFDGSIGVYALDDGTFEIYTGHLRYYAMKELGKPTIPAHIKQLPSSEAAKWEDLIAANLDGRVMSPTEIGRALVAYEENVLKAGPYDGNASDDLAERFKMSAPNVKRYKAIIKLVPELQELADKGVSFSALIGATTLSPEDQKMLASAIVKEQEKGQTPTREEIKSKIKEISKKETKKENPIFKSCRSFSKTITKTADNISGEEKEKLVTELRVIELQIKELLEKLGVSSSATHH